MPVHVTTQTNDASYFTLSYKTTLYDMSCATQDAVCCLKALPLSYEHLIFILPTPPPPSLSFHLNLQVQIIPGQFEQGTSSLTDVFVFMNLSSLASVIVEIKFVWAWVEEVRLIVHTSQF